VAVPILPSSRCRPRSTSPRSSSWSPPAVHVLVEKGRSPTPPERARELIAAVPRVRRPRRGFGHGRAAATRRCGRCAGRDARRPSWAQVLPRRDRADRPVFPARIRDRRRGQGPSPTHDLDLVGWPRRRRRGSRGGDRDPWPRRPQHRMGREHEDLVQRRRPALGWDDLHDDGRTWLSPTKVRPDPGCSAEARHARRRHAGPPNLTFYANGEVSQRVGTRTRTLRGGQRGANVTRYALSLPAAEPLLVELEEFCGYVQGRPRSVGGDAGGRPSPRVDLGRRGPPRSAQERRRGVPPRRAARPAERTGNRTRPAHSGPGGGAEGRPVRIVRRRAPARSACPLAAFAALARARGDRLRHRRPSWSPRSGAAREPFPGEAGLSEALTATIADGRLRARDRHGRPRSADGADLILLVPPAGGRRGPARSEVGRGRRGP